MALFLFFDESGNLDFSPTGTRFYTFGCLSTREPGSLLQPLSELRYSLLEAGVDIPSFHASEDRQAIRDQVFNVLAGVRHLEFDAIIVEKRKLHPSLYEPEKFYPKFARYLLQYVFQRCQTDERVILVTDRLPIKRQREAVEKAFKTFVKSDVGNRPFTVVHHPSAAHLCLQAADYCTWAIHKKWSQADTRSYSLIKPLIKSEFDIFQTGTEHFY